jgi:outer membrane protein assembly factor BamB
LLIEVTGKEGHMQRIPRIKILTFITTVFIAGSVWSGDQPQPGQRYTRNMVSTETGLPDRFDPDTGLNLKWKIPLGTQSYSTPVVSNGRVFIGTNNDKPRDPNHIGDRGILYCLNETDGSLLWQLVVPKLQQSRYWDWPGEGIVSPATVEGDRVYIVSNRGEVLCLDIAGMANGNDGPYLREANHMVPQDSAPKPLTTTDADIIWLFDIINETGVRQHDAAHGSILLHDRYLYVNTSNGVDDAHTEIHAPDAPSLIVLDKTSGRLVARDAEKIGPNIFHSTWSSPAMGKLNDQWQVYFGGGDGICYAFGAVNTLPGSGKPAQLGKIWWYDGDPAAPKENVSQYLRNRRESPSNIISMPVFHNGRVYLTLGGDIWWGKRKAWLKCIDASGSGDVTETGEIWTYALNRHVGATPSVSNGLVFVGDCGQMVHCVDADTGKPYWTHKTGGQIWASTLVADDKVYVGTRKGDFWVFAADPVKKIIHKTTFEDAIHGTATAANGTLYIATMKHLYAFTGK